MASLSQWERSRADATNSPEQLPVLVPPACIFAELQGERDHMLVGSGGHSIPIIDTTTLNCDQTLFLAVFLHVIFKSNIIFCGC